MSTGKQATYYAAWQPDHAINSQETLLLLSALLLFAMHFSLVRLSIVPPRKRMPTMPARKLPHALVNLTHVCNQILRQREPLRAFLALERPRRLVRMHRPHMPLHIIRPPKHLPADRARRLCARRRRGLRAFRGVRATGGRRGPARARGGTGLGSDLSAEAGSGVAELVKILDCRSVRRDELLPDAGVSTIAGAGLRLADGFRLVDNVVRFKCVFSGGTIRSSIAQYGSVWLNSSNPFRNSSASSESFSISHAHGFLPFSISANTGETPAPSP
mmetsp:Transcript_2119/g.5676  ORF Transcript_2119/g.5676 Transcript_2119/m.5676 type:complete len:273 (-) Transcript_2119:101-919(-)